jgi:hypothetical protein
VTNTRLRSILLGLACPPLYLWRRRRWVGVGLVGIVWLIAVTIVGEMLYAIFRYDPQWEMSLFLYVGLLFWLLSGLTAWLWGWWPLVGALAGWLVVLLALFMILASCELSSSSPRRLPPVPPGPVGRLQGVPILVPDQIANPLRQYVSAAPR